MTGAAFAVVGHPNKGKSSIVAALMEDDSVAIGSASGTTRKRQYFPLKVAGKTLFQLVDTPGFQRPRQVLQWLQQTSKSVADRPQTVKQFVQTFAATDQFPDECELLEPIVNGAGIIYVVDGGVPYGNEYEAEMEILRWSGQPSMALINAIGNKRYEAQWASALGQYFKIVRPINPLLAQTEQRLELLSAFAQLCDQWRQPLLAAVAALRQHHRERDWLVSRCIATLLIDSMTYAETKKVAANQNPADFQQELEQRYKTHLRSREQLARREVERLYHYHRLEREESEIDTDSQPDLFASDYWYLWGLSRKQLIAASAGGSAIAGAGIDALLGGSSLGIVAASSGIAGGLAAWLGADKLAKLKVKGVLPLGGRLLSYGPTVSHNFPYVIIGRAIAHIKALQQRTHAHRDTLVLTESVGVNNSWYNQLTPEQQKNWNKMLARLNKFNSVDEGLEGKITSAIAELIIETEHTPPNA